MIEKIITQALGLRPNQVAQTIELLNEGATIPFISRYRKERTGGLDEVEIASIKEQYERLTELVKRRETILKTIGEQEKLTDELEKRIRGCWDSSELEDIYLPYKPKKRTRAEVARQKGLEPLAMLLLAENDAKVEREAERFVKDQVGDRAEALKGAQDIVAEMVSENEASRNNLRAQFLREAVISSRLVKGKEEEGDKYRDYFDFSEPLNRCSSHRVLALKRAENEGILKLDISPDDERAVERLEKQYLRFGGEGRSLLCEALKDGYKRLLKPSIATEFEAAAKERADEEAIKVFVENLRQLLLAAPLGAKRVLAIDPGFRTGCKVVCLNEQGDLLHNEAIYPHPPQEDFAGASHKLSTLVESYRIDAIAIGNGTASRETERFVQRVGFKTPVKVFVVSENGASIYSASKVARDEFPEYDVTVRGAISIGRRLMDPLAELVKIDPKSIGVGQYQHDVNQSKLKSSLDRTVESCVNQVGVDLNRASKHILTYISGLGATLAQNIVDYRTCNGAFCTRKELMKVARMGAKSFEQCAGFLRVPESSNPLDNSAVHPESYSIVEQMAKDLNCTVGDLICDKDKRSKIDLYKYVSECVGEPTLKDILAELEKPGRDPRSEIEVFEFDSSIRTIGDLREGQVLPGIVTNITNFGCFVDVGIKENGLCHISEMSDRFVKDPNEIVKLHQHVTVKVIGVDLHRKRVQLSMKNEPRSENN